MSLWSALQDGVITPEQAREFAVRAANYRIYRAGRWLQHIENRLLYERAMLDEAGGDPGERFDFAVGGRVLTRGEWRVITRINKKDGRVLSLSTNRFTVQVEDVKEYQPPTREEVETVKAATKLAPMCNYPGENFLYLTKDQWDRLAKDYRGSETLKATGQYGEHRVRRRYGVGFKQNLVFLMDAKVVEPPPPPQKPQERPVLPPVERDVLSAPTAYQAPPRTVFDDMRDQIEGRSSNESVPMTIAISEHVLTVLRRATLTDDSVVLPEQMERKLYEEVNRILERAGGRWDRSRKAHLFGEGPKRVLGRAIETGVLNTADVNIAKANFRPGVQAFVVPGLFPTPPDLARQVVRTGDVRPGQRVLEPEAGTGNLVRAVLNEFTGADCGKIVAIESNANLAEALREQKRLTLYANDDNFTVYHRDFLTVTPEEIGKFDRIVMNPPFENGQDIADLAPSVDALPAPVVKRIPLRRPQPVG